MRLAVSSPCSVVDLRKRQAEFRRHHAAIAPTRAPTHRVRIEHRAVDAAFLQRVRGGEARIARADHGHIDDEIASERRARADGRLLFGRCAPPSRAITNRAAGVARALSRSRARA